MSLSNDYRHSGLGQSSLGLSPGGWVGKGVGGGKGGGGVTFVPG